MIDIASRARDVTAIGLLHADDGRLVDIRLVVSGSVRRNGQGTISLTVADPAFDLQGATLVWLVTTNKGWAHMRGEAAHMRGEAVVAGVDGRRPFRADLFAAHLVGDAGPDRFALRIYGAAEDPNVASPTHKIAGWMAVGSIRL